MDPDYQLFVAVVEAGSLSAAGRVLHISPPMVSKRLARLEARLGVRLVHRTTRQLALTEAGARFHKDVVAILQTIREAESRLTNIYQKPRGPLRVSAPTSFGRLHLAPHLADFLALHDEVELELNLTDDFVDLVAQRIDVAIRISPEMPASLAMQRLASNRRILCASPIYLERHGVPETISDLNSHRLLAATGQLPWRLTDGRRSIVFEGTSHVGTNSSEIVRELAVAGVGIALRSLWDIDGELSSGKLRRLLAPWEGPRNLGIHAVYPRSPIRAPAVTAFVDFLAERFRTSDW